MSAIRASLLLLLIASPLEAAIDAFCYPQSVAQGDTVGVYIDADADSVQVRVQRDATAGYIAPYTASSAFIVPTDQAVPDSSYWYGTGWVKTMDIVVGASWTPGVYFAEVWNPPDSSSTTRRWAPFIVREDNPGSRSKILVSLPTSTWDAYNNFGGKSLYDSGSTNSKRSWVSSKKRPYVSNSGKSRYPFYSQYFVTWADTAYTLEYCSDLDLKDILTVDNYQLLILPGHDEYWDNDRRNAVDAFTRQGGNMYVASGNTLWWQTRAAGDTAIICYKDSAGVYDPIGVDSLLTDLWDVAPISKPSTSTTGLTYRTGNGVTGSDWIVRDAGHWMLAGTSLGFLDSLSHGSVAGDELDGADMTFSGGVPTITGTDGAPANLTVAATAACLFPSASDTTYAVMGSWVNARGWVATTPMRKWAIPMTTNANVEQITRNVIDTLMLNQYSVVFGSLTGTITAGRGSRGVR